MQSTGDDSHNSMSNVWKYLVHDYLEMACFLTDDQRDHLIEELGRENIVADFIQVYPSFSIDGRVVVVCGESSAAQQCWLYAPKDKTIMKKQL